MLESGELLPSLVEPPLLVVDVSFAVPSSVEVSLEAGEASSFEEVGGGAEDRWEEGPGRLAVGSSEQAVKSAKEPQVAKAAKTPEPRNKFRCVNAMNHSKLDGLGSLQRQVQAKRSRADTPWEWKSVHCSGHASADTWGGSSDPAVARFPWGHEGSAAMRATWTTGVDRNLAQAANVELCR